MEQTDNPTQPEQSDPPPQGNGTPSPIPGVSFTNIPEEEVGLFVSRWDKLKVTAWELYASGKSSTIVSEELGLPARCLHRWISKYEWRKKRDDFWKKNGVPASVAEERRVRLREVRLKENLKRKEAKDNPIPLAPKGHGARDGRIYEEAKALYMGGMTVRAISDKMGIPHNTVQAWCYERRWGKEMLLSDDKGAPASVLSAQNNIQAERVRLKLSEALEKQVDALGESEVPVAQVARQRMADLTHKIVDTARKLYNWGEGEIRRSVDVRILASPERVIVSGPVSKMIEAGKSPYIEIKTEIERSPGEAVQPT